MKNLLFLCVIISFSELCAQLPETKLPFGNVRISFLVFPPFSPLLTIEMRTFDKFTVQLETNFKNTHGINLKHFINKKMQGQFIFVGLAFIENDFFRKDKNITFLPYIGFGYAHRFGSSKEWIFDSRLGIAKTINADNNTIFPVLKTGIGRIF